MYLYRIIIRDVLVPIAHSELSSYELMKEVEEAIFYHNYALNFLVFVTALLFLAMYYYFANQTPQEKMRKTTDRARRSTQLMTQAGRALKQIEINNET